MRTPVRWFDIDKVRIAISARPRGGDWLDDEIDGWRAEGVRLVVSLLEREEIEELDLGREASSCDNREIGFLSFPIRDRGVPASSRETARLVDQISARLRLGHPTLIHCRAGIGRSSLIAACALTRFDVTPSETFAIARAARGLRVPDTDEQYDWVERFALSKA